METQVVMEDKQFELAATILTDFVESKKLQFSTPVSEIQETYQWFQMRFSPDVLKALSDEELLQRMFLTTGSSNDSLCYHLEFNPKVKSFFGSISGGSSFKFGLFQRQEDGKWMTGSPQKQEILSDEDALALGKQIRDFLVNAAEYIAVTDLSSVHDYELLDSKLRSMFDKYASLAWVQKYFQMIFPDKFVGWYAKDWQCHILYCFGILPSEKYYGRNGQLALIRKKTNYINTHFQDACWQLFGDIKHFFRLGSSDESANYANHWMENGIIAIGWNDVGDLTDYLKNGVLDRDKLAAKLSELYYQDDPRTASRKAGEIKSFYEASSDAVFVVMDGDRLLGFVERTTPCYYDDQEPMSHCRKGNWLKKFEASDQLPETEGRLTSCYEFRKPANLIFLYSKLMQRSGNLASGAAIGLRHVMIDESTRLTGGENIILYGVPGSGKSWTIEHEYCEDKARMERLVFHPDYMYSDFIGQILPIVREDKVRYEFSPGPFTKLLRKAYLDPAHHYYLIIEEINRGNAPAIFGEVFQLLDRITEPDAEYPVGTSEYEITNSNIAQIVYADPERKVRLPSNFSIIGTMNTSDQNVFTLDTAFQRRWIMRMIQNSFEPHRFANHSILDTTVSWKAFCYAINDEVLRRNNVTSSEDKRLGAYFITAADLIWHSEEDTIEDHSSRIWIDARHSNARFAEKVLKYLWDDAFKFSHPEVFNTGTYRSLEMIIAHFCNARGNDRFVVFNENLLNQILDQAQANPADNVLTQTVEKETDKQEDGTPQ